MGVIVTKRSTTMQSIRLNKKVPRRMQAKERKTNNKVKVSK